MKQITILGILIVLFSVSPQAMIEVFKIAGSFAFVIGAIMYIGHLMGITPEKYEN